MTKMMQKITETNVIIDTYTSISELMESGYLNRYAENFDREHLIESEMFRWSKYNPSFYIVEANATYNYGLDFKIMVSYKADGVNFFKELSLGSGALTSGNLRMVTFDANKIEYLEYIFPKGNEFRKHLRFLSDNGHIFN